MVRLRTCYFRKMNLITMHTMNWRKSLKGRKPVNSAYLPNSSCIALVSAFVSCLQNVFSVEGRRWSSMWSLNWFLEKALILRCGKILSHWVANRWKKSKSSSLSSFLLQLLLWLELRLFSVCSIFSVSLFNLKMKEKISIYFPGFHYLTM